jgi:hypothetical protein
VFGRWGHRRRSDRGELDAAGLVPVSARVVHAVPVLSDVRSEIPRRSHANLTLHSRFIVFHCSGF